MPTLHEGDDGLATKIQPEADMQNNVLTEGEFNGFASHESELIVWDLDTFTLKTSIAISENANGARASSPCHCAEAFRFVIHLVINLGLIVSLVFIYLLIRLQGQIVVVLPVGKG